VPNNDNADDEATLP